MLERLSEKVGPTGSLQGEGLANLLGRPPFDPLTLALRESGQNIWDARDRTRSVPTMLVRVRTLTATQAPVLGRLFQAGEESDDEPADTNLLSQCLAANLPTRVLEICDFGTVGLSGLTDPQSAEGNFVKFFFDIGTSHFDGGDGGTYGYGRSSLYLASKARTILVDSLTAGSTPSRRFMGSRIGTSYERITRGQTKRYTGRHFWGKALGEGGVAPVEGRMAEALARALGMPERGQGTEGTTILIPWPEMPESGAGTRIAEILLHNLWPKLVSTSGDRAMKIEVEEDGVVVPISNPRTHATYRLLAEALLTARTRNERFGAVPIEVHRPKRTTGHIAFARSEGSLPISSDQGADDRPEHLFKGSIHHVALMRPSELVVRYLEFPGVGEDMNWAGVFLCAEDEVVMRAFASSEPPAHDDWVPDRLSGAESTLVRVTKLKRIPEAVNHQFGIRLGMQGRETGANASLAAAADRFASQFLSGDGSGAAADEGGRGGNDGGANGPKLKPLTFVGLTVSEGRKMASFRTAIAGNIAVHVRGSAVVEGAGGSDALPDDLLLPAIRGWRHPDGSYTAGNVCEIAPGGDYVMEVEFRGVYAVVARCEMVRG